MGSIKDNNGMDLTEAEDIEKRWQEYTEEHWGTRVSFNSGFLSVYAQQWDCWVSSNFIHLIRTDSNVYFLTAE